MPRLQDCCGFDLRTGSLIVLWLSVIWWTSWIFFDFPLVILFFAASGNIIFIMLGVLAWILSLAAAIISGMGIYGVLTNEPKMLKMFTVISILVIVFRFGSAVIVTFWYFMKWVQYESSSIGKDPERTYFHDTRTSFHRSESHTSNSGNFIPELIRNIIGFLISCYDVSIVVLSFIQWYFMNVVRSFYLQLEEGPPIETRGRITPLFLQQRTNSGIETDGT